MDKAWKAYERKVAKMFGMKRALQKGTKAKEDVAPEEGIDAAKWIIDAKKRKTIEVWSWMADLVKYAKEKDKPAILVFQPWGKPGDYAIMEYSWFMENFRSHIDCFYQSSLNKGVSRFEVAWSEVKSIAKRTNSLPLLHLCPIAIPEYTCIKAENLISLMKAKGLLTQENG